SGLIDANNVTFNNGKIYLNSSTSGSFSNCALQNTPLYIRHNSLLVISKSNFDLFSSVNNSSLKNVDARNNFWGDPTGPKHSTNPNGYGTPISDKVDYIPFATTPFDITVGIEEISKNIPFDFSLNQNYPNPFNPTTTISYSIPKESFVTIKIYDVLGKEVATLVDEFQKPGTYNYQLSIGNYQLSSGVYFYKMDAGNFSETKKLILLK
ncbi:T9SS C-terminal target domain-containing protein, partial [Bacteroidetes/Chlorobi group bacterium ChocPot_Mid]